LGQQDVGLDQEYYSDRSLHYQGFVYMANG
jgi:hypothetical protein